MSDLNLFRILVLDDNPAIHSDFRKILSRDQSVEELNQLEQELFGSDESTAQLPDYEIDSAFQGLEGVEKVQQALVDQKPYSLAFVDMRMPPGIGGVDAIEKMWEIAPDLQIVICTAYSDYSWTEIITRLGWSDRLLILKKPFDKAEVCQLALALSVKHQLERMARLKTEDLRAMVAQRTIELENEIRQREYIEKMLRENPHHVNNPEELDVETGLLNRGAILERIRFLATDADVHGTLYSLVFVDVDRLSEMNEAYGVETGSAILKAVGQRLKDQLRSNDVIGRYGTEEFIVGLRNCSGENAVQFGERLRNFVADKPLDIDGLEISITVSVGVSTQDPEFREATEKVIDRAGQATHRVTGTEAPATQSAPSEPMSPSNGYEPVADSMMAEQPASEQT